MEIEADRVSVQDATRLITTKYLFSESLTWRKSILSHVRMELNENVTTSRTTVMRLVELEDLSSRLQHAAR